MCRLAIILGLLFAQSIHAEWIEAEMQGAANTVWVNTEQDALYSGGDCAPFMSLHHMQGRKPRNLQQRRQEHSLNSTTENGKGVHNQVPRDNLDMVYLSQPEYDPLNRNSFSIAINNSSVTLTSPQGRIKGAIRGRYDQKPGC